MLRHLHDGIYLQRNDYRGGEKKSYEWISPASIFHQKLFIMVLEYESFDNTKLFFYVLKKTHTAHTRTSPYFSIIHSNVKASTRKFEKKQSRCK